MVGDITCIPTWQGWAFLATVIDCYTKAVIGWATSDNYKTPLISAAIGMAVRNHDIKEGAVFHSDRGPEPLHSRPWRTRRRQVGRGVRPDRSTALVNELRRRGFTDTEIVASGLRTTSRTGQLTDRFRNRVMVGVRGHMDRGIRSSGSSGRPRPAPPDDVAPVLHSPSTAIYRPGVAVFGLAEQAEGTRRPCRRGWPPTPCRPSWRPRLTTSPRWRRARPR